MHIVRRRSLRNRKAPTDIAEVVQLFRNSTK